MNEDEYIQRYLSVEHENKAVLENPERFTPNLIEQTILEAVAKGMEAFPDEPGEIRAEFLRILVLGLRDDWPVMTAGIQIFAPRSRMTGTLDLAGGRAKNGGALPSFKLFGCIIEDYIDASAAHFVSLNLSSCRKLGIRAPRIRIDGNLQLNYSHCHWIDFANADIGGFVDAQFATSYPNRSGLVDFTFSNAKIGGDVQLKNFRSYGSGPRFANAQIGGGVYGTGMRIRADGLALELNGAHVGGSVLISLSRIHGIIQAHNARIKGGVSFTFVGFRSQRYSLQLTNAHIGKSLSLSRCCVTGGLLCVGLTVDSGVYLRNTRIRGAMGEALLLDGAKVSEFESPGTTFYGCFSANSAHFTKISLADGKYFASENDKAIDLSNAVIAQVVLLSGCSSNAAAQVNGSLLLNNAQIGVSLEMDRVSFAVKDRNNPCLNMTRSNINGTFNLRHSAGPRNGKFILQGAYIDTLDDDPETGWPAAGLIDLDGLTYRAVNARMGVGIGNELADRRIAWLKRQYKDGQPGLGEFRPQPFEQLAKILRGVGFDYAATRVSIEKRELQRKYADRGIARFIHTILKITSDYGYSPARALAGFVAWVALGSILAKWGLIAGIFERTNPDASDTSHLEPISFAFDLSTPIIDFGQSSAYRMIPACYDFFGISFCGGFELLRIVYSVVGFVLFSILVLTFSGVLRQES